MNNMRKIKILVIVLLLYISCNNKKASQVGNESITTSILVDLGNSLKFNWDLSEKVIIDDSLLNDIKRDYQEKRTLLIQKIKDTTSTRIMICSSEQQLKKGDLAFLLLDKIEDLNYYEDLGIQMDTFVIGCPYPDHLLIVLDNQRNLIIEKLGSGSN